jgi:hypothetical protein
VAEGACGDRSGRNGPTLVLPSYVSSRHAVSGVARSCCYREHRRMWMTSRHAQYPYGRTTDRFPQGLLATITSDCRPSRNALRSQPFADVR